MAAKIPTEAIIPELQRVAKKLGHPPTRDEFNKHGAFSRDVVCAHFGIWNKGLSAAGLEINLRREPTSKAEGLAELRRVAKKLGHTPTIAEFTEHASFGRLVVVRRFGTWNKGLKAAGLALNSTHTSANPITKAQCSIELKRLAKRLGHTPTTAEFEEKASFSMVVVCRCFGSLNKALEAAGLKLNIERDTTNAKCLSELKRVAKKLGHTPTINEFTELASMCAAPIQKRFGSWNKGLAAAGLVLNTAHGISNAQCLTELKRIAKKLGHTPTREEFHEQAASMCAGLIEKRFGSWNKGLEAAGLEVNHSQTTSSDRTATTERAHRILQNIPGSIANMLPDVLIKALFDLLGKAAPSLISQIAETESSIRLNKKRSGGLGKALKAVEQIITLSKGQENKIVLAGVMNTIDRMHNTSKEALAYRTAVLKSKCKFAQTMAKQYRTEVQRVNEIIRTIRGMRYEQALLTIKLERPEGWYYAS